MGTEITVPIVCISAGRYERITTHKAVDNLIICVPPNEVEYYKINCPDNEIIEQPKLKNLGMIRQYVYEKFGNVMMLDDDMKHMLRVYEDVAANSKVDSNTAYWIIQQTANIAAMMGVYLFGYGKWANPLRQTGHKPFYLTGAVDGKALGMLQGIDIKFNPKIVSNNDMFMSLMNAHKHRRVFIDERFAIATKEYAGQIGGAAKIRTDETEQLDFILLQKLFGKAIQIKKETNFSKNKKAFAKSAVIPY